MSLKINTRCAFCKETLDYLDTDSKKVFRSTVDHDDQACKDYLYSTVSILQDRVTDLTKRLEEEQERAKVEKLRSYTKEQRFRERIENITQTRIKAPQDQKKKLIDQCHRWQALYERERMKRHVLRKEITHIYGTLDFRMGTDCIVDPAAKAVAEYTIKKLRNLVRKNR